MNSVSQKLSPHGTSEIVLVSTGVCPNFFGGQFYSTVDATRCTLIDFDLRWAEQASVPAELWLAEQAPTVARFEGVAQYLVTLFFFYFFFIWSID